MAAKLVELRREAWARFFHHVSRSCKGRPVILRQSGRAVGLESVVAGLPLLCISTDETGEGLEPSIRVMVGNAADGSVTEYLAAPTHVRVSPSNGRDGTLKIESRTGQTIQIRLADPEGLPCYPFL